MKRIVILIMAAFLVLPAFTQESKKARKQAQKAAKKEQKMKENAATAAIIQACIQSRKFVLEAQFLANKKGQRVVVDPILNFIVVNEKKCTFQFGNGRDAGYNGLGGVTVEGKIFDFKVDENKKGFNTIKFRATSSTGTIFVNMNISSLGDAQATISGSTSSRLEYSGIIVPLEESRIYKGSRVF